MDLSVSQNEGIFREIPWWVTCHFNHLILAYFSQVRYCWWRSSYLQLDYFRENDGKCPYIIIHHVSPVSLVEIWVRQIWSWASRCIWQFWASIFSVISRSGFLGVSARQQIPSIPNQSKGLGQHVAQKKETRGQIRSNFCSPNDWRTRRFATVCRSNNWRLLRKHSQTSFKSSWKLYQAASAEGAEGPEGLGFSCSALKCQSCCSSLSNSSFIMRYRMECSPAAEDLCGT